MSPLTHRGLVLLQRLARDFLLDALLGALLELVAVPRPSLHVKSAGALALFRHGVRVVLCGTEAEAEADLIARIWAFLRET